MSDGSVPIEEFIHAITTQLDRVQDALRLKAVNRPLTYALRDLSMELHVFVEVDPQGVVRFRTSAPNEAGASVINIAFTTITKPMIEENTVSMSAVRSGSLQDLGLDPQEQRRLEQLGVHNVAQLNRLESNAGASTIARLSDVPMDRLREVLGRARPRVREVVPVPDSRNGPAAPPPSQPPRAPVAPPQPVPYRGASPPSALPAAPVPRAPVGTPLPSPGRWSPARAPNAVPVGSRRVALVGRHLTSGDLLPEVWMNAQPLAVAAGADDQLLVDLPDDFNGGTLEIRHASGDMQTFDLRLDDSRPDGERDGEWAPVEG